MTYETPRHKVFPSFHHEDQAYKNRFVQMMEHDFVDKSVEDGDIDDNLRTETIRQKIRDEFIRDASVTIVLIGPGTWQRKHVDWEIGSSLRKTQRNSRCGLLGILLPNHPDYNKDIHTPGLIPPRLHDNLAGPNSYASIHRWTNNPKKIREWIHSAYQRKGKILPNNNRKQYKNNKRGNYSRGWSERDAPRRARQRNIGTTRSTTNF